MTTRSPELLGDKAGIRKTFARHIVATIMSDHPGRSIGDLSILELGSGAGFFAHAYHEVYGEMLESLVQTDADPQHAGVATMDVSGLSSFGRQFDVVLSIDVLSCLSFGAGLDPEDGDDVDALAALNDGLPHVLATGSAFYYDFMACAPNSQFVLRFVPEYCSTRPGRFICVLDPGSDEASGSADEAEAEPLLFVTFDASLLRHIESAAGPLLHVTGHDTPFSYSSLCERLLPTTRDDESRAFALKVLEFLFRDINDGGCPDNWELMSYVSVDPAHFSEVFEDDSERLVPVFLDTFRRAVLFLRESFRGESASYEELRVVDAFTSVVAKSLTRHRVEFVEADVMGSDGGCYTQRYHYANICDSESDGCGSFRCLVTKCQRRS